MSQIIKRRLVTLLSGVALTGAAALLAITLQPAHNPSVAPYPPVISGP